MGEAPRGPNFSIDTPYIRLTAVCRRQGGRSGMVHGRLSSDRTGARPDQGGPQ